MSNVPNSASLARASGTSIQREGFGERGIEQRHETASTAIAAQMQAEIQARYIMAMQRPRDDDDVRQRLLKECKRPNFAARAYYSIPRKGAKPGRITRTPGRVEGLTVRFAESAIRISGNILQSTRTTYDDDYKRMINVSATDLETNAVYSRDIIIEKTVERSAFQEGDVVLGERLNSAGNKVYIVQSTEDQLLVKESALVSKMFRTEALRFVPADTLEECERQILATVKDEDAKDPDAARKAIADFFASMNVMPSDLKTYLGHDLAQCSPTELVDLRGIAGALKDGVVSWAEVIAEKTAAASVDPTTGEVKPDAKAAGSAVADKIRANREKRAAAGAKDSGASPQTGPSQATAESKPREQKENRAATSPQTAPSGVSCAVCGKPVAPGQGVQTTDSDGVVGERHPDCSPFGVPAEREPGVD